MTSSYTIVILLIKVVEECLAFEKEVALKWYLIWYRMIYIILLLRKNLPILYTPSVLDIISQMVINVYHLLLVLISLLKIGMGGQVFIFCLTWKLIFGMWQLVI